MRGGGGGRKRGGVVGREYRFAERCRRRVRKGRMVEGVAGVEWEGVGRAEKGGGKKGTIPCSVHICIRVIRPRMELLQIVTYISYKFVYAAFSMYLCWYKCFH